MARIFKNAQLRNFDKLANRLDSSTITATCRLRPPRIASLIDPSDKAGLSTAIRINTCLWGGVFNPIIPLYGSCPKSWKSADEFFRGTADDITDIYLNTFEPDSLTQFKSTKFNFDVHPYAELRMMYGQERFEPSNFGITVEPIYEEYLRHFGASVKKPKLLLAGRKKETDDLFNSMVYGAFPAHWKGFVADCRNHFEVEEPSRDATQLASLFDPKAVTPFDLGRYLLTVQNKARKAPCIFVLDCQSIPELIDFWNLRALGWPLIAYPIQWGQAGIDFIERTAAKREPTKPLHVIRGRNIDEHRWQEFAEALRATQNIAIAKYPRFWDDWHRRADDTERPEVYFEQFTRRFKSNIEQFGFDYSKPHYLQGPSKSHSIEPKITATVSLTGVGNETQKALVLPYGFELPWRDSPLNRDDIRFTSEGFTSRVSLQENSVTFSPPSTQKCFETWFETRGFQTRPSAAGVNARELVASFDWLADLTAYAKPELLKLFESLSAGKWLVYKSLVDRLNQACRSSDKPGADLVKKYVAHQSMALGLELTCTFCNHSGWHALDRLAPQIHCVRCLKSFSFPMAPPPSNSWSYRTQGAFSLPGYANGAFSVALAAKFLLVNCFGRGSWYPGIELSPDGKKWFEIDLAMWWQDCDLLTPGLILVECKTFDEFDERDFERAKWAIEKFPECTFVFATLKDALSPKEIQGIKKIVLSSRRTPQQYGKHKKRKLNVLVLTAKELFESVSPPYCWRQELMYRSFKNQFDDSSNLSTIERMCDITQQLHLGLPSLLEWTIERSKLITKSGNKN